MVHWWIQQQLTAQSGTCGHWLGMTHLLLTLSITWPNGHPQPGVHPCMHIGLGSVQVAGQGGHSWNVCPSIEQAKTIKRNM